MTVDTIIGKHNIGCWGGNILQNIKLIVRKYIENKAMLALKCLMFKSNYILTCHCDAGVYSFGAQNFAVHL